MKAITPAAGDEQQVRRLQAMGDKAKCDGSVGQSALLWVWGRAGP